MKKKTENQRQNFETGAVILVFSTIIVKIIGFFFKIPILNLLGDEGGGYFYSAYDLFTPFYVMAISGLPVGMARLIASAVAGKRYYSAQYYASVSKRLFFSIGFVGAALFGIAIPLFSAVTNAEDNAIVLWAVVPSIFFFCVMSYYRGIYEAFENMTPTAVSDIIEALGKLVLGLGFAAIVKKLTNNMILSAAAALFGIMVGVFFATVYLAFKYRKDNTVKGFMCLDNESKEENLFKKMLSVIIPITISAVLANSFASVTDVLTIGRSLERAGIENPALFYGIRSKAFTIYNLVPAITTVIGVSVVPTLAKAKTAKIQSDIKHKTEELLKMAVVFSLPAGMGMSFLSRPIMNLIYTGDTAEFLGSELLRVYGVAAFFAGVSVVIIHALQALMRQKTALILLVLGMTVKFICNILLISRKDIGIMGAAYSTVFAYFIIFIIGVIILVKETEISLVRGILLKPLLATIVCIICSSFAANTDSKVITLLAIFIAVLVYFVLIIAFKTFSREEILAFPGGKMFGKVLFSDKKCL